MAVITSLVAYWALDEASGNATDAHGSNTLTDNNTVAAAAGKVSGARDFEADNTTESLSITDNTDVSTGDIAFSCAFWVKIEDLPGTMTVFAKDDNSGQREYGLYYASGNATLRFYVFGPGAEFTEVSSAAVSQATWYHVVCWHDPTGNVIGITLNDGSATTSAHTAGVKDGTAAFHLGNRSDAGNPFDGMLDEFGLWKKVLDSSERTWLYNSGNGRSYADIVAESGGGGTPKRLLLLGVGDDAAAASLIVGAPALWRYRRMEAKRLNGQ